MTMCSSPKRPAAASPSRGRNQRPGQAGSAVALEVGVRVALSAFMVSAVTCFAQSTPVGLWRNIDDKTGEAKAEIRITESAGALNGRIEKILRKDAKPDEKCVECKDERKDQPMVGLEIIRGAKKSSDGEGWQEGKILDPENGREYKLRLTPTDGGAKLQVRGSFGPFWRTQTWIRVQ
jgi:uncharacterized protein (DUF2147 family)